MTAALRYLIQVVPDLPPSINGVGDYALGLARAMRACHGINSVFLIAGRSPSRASEIEGFRIVRLERQESGALASALAGEVNENGAVLVQYVGYGYDPNGAPRWLVDGLDIWRQHSLSCRLVTMFHELYATSWPWRRAFWFSRQQQTVAKRLTCLSDNCVTSLQYGADIIRQWRGRSRSKQSVTAVAIPSNVGEPAIIRPLAEREPSMVIFGSYGNRRNAYRMTRRELSQSCALLGIQEIIDVGPGEIEGVVLPASVRYRRTGTLDAESISTLLLRSRAGFLNYPAEYLAKSGVFAAYCSHGMLPVLGKAGPSGKDGIDAARHYWHSGLGLTDPATFQAIATEAKIWYGGHRLKRHALMFTGALRSVSTIASLV